MAALVAGIRPRGPRASSEGEEGSHGWSSRARGGLPEGAWRRRRHGTRGEEFVHGDGNLRGFSSAAAWVAGDHRRGRGAGTRRHSLVRFLGHAGVEKELELLVAAGRGGPWESLVGGDGSMELGATSGWPDWKIKEGFWIGRGSRCGRGVAAAARGSLGTRWFV